MFPKRVGLENRQVRRLCSLQNASGVKAGLAQHFLDAGAVAQATGGERRLSPCKD
jgi:hypothetical protein